MFTQKSTVHIISKVDYLSNENIFLKTNFSNIEKKEYKNYIKLVKVVLFDLCQLWRWTDYIFDWENSC